MDGVMGARDSGRFVTENSKDVFVNDDGVEKLAKILYEKVKCGDFNVTMWRKHELNPQGMDEDAVNWVFVSAVLNFSFWSQKPTDRFAVTYKDKQHTGYWSLCAAMNRALDEGIPFTTASYYATVDLDTMKKIFRSDNEFEIPMLEERVRVLNEAGKVLLEKYNGSFANVIKEAGKSAQALLRIVVNNFPSFQDVAEFSGKKVGIYKRVQILIGDVWGCCEGKGLGEFDDIDTITMFADYRIPQALVFYGVLKYSDSLMEKLKQVPLLKSGERIEVEIRGVSLWACELVRDKILELLKADREKDVSSYDVNAILVDHYLWDVRRELADQMMDIPFHRCRGIFY
ncbi:queuosine salvage protein isoform X2 [Aplysia californica]|nr:queuosine salvage protein isoform X2 [Aplysia californica]XP_035829447.1 queuosine salvage protein isoform X2 [Aplysia californica]